MHKLLMITFTLCISSNSVTAEVDPWKESHRMEQVFQYDSAINVLKNISSNNELVNLRRGWLNYLKGSHSKSIEHYKKAIKSNNLSLDARLGIILPLLEQQRWREAASNANKVLNVAPWNYYAHVRLMQTEEALKEWEKLFKHSDEVHQRYPSDATVLVYMARASHKLGNKKQAKDLYNKVIELIPGHFESNSYIK